MVRKKTIFCALCALLVIAPLTARAATSCENLTSLKLPHTTITAKTIAAGAFPAPGPAAPGLTFSAWGSLPSFCRVQGVLEPSKDSHIEFEVWLPMADWNGKYKGAGNGGFAGYINYPDLALALKSGYVSSSTDTGHKGQATDAKWALGHPEKIVDFGYRAVHETAERSKEIIRSFYGKGDTHSYFSSCSNGGRQGLMEAQRYPGDYDGIIVGAPAANFTRILGSFAWNMLATAVDPATYIPQNKYSAIEAAVVGSCDARDGVKDHIIDEPNKCGFDPSPLLCKGQESNACLTSPQLSALKKIYDGPRTSKGERLYPGFMPGGESGPGGWSLWFSGPTADRSLQYAFSTQGAANLVFQNAGYDYRTFNVDRDVKAADDSMGRTLNAIDPNLSAFQKRGGKLILYHGWSDAALPPTATIDYYNSVVSKMGQKTADSFLQLYMVPGMQHCGGGPGADNFGVAPGYEPNVSDSSRNMTAALERWVEQGQAPSGIVASKFKASGTAASGVVMTRQLCSYPKVAQYKGSGSSSDAANFVCTSSPQR